MDIILKLCMERKEQCKWRDKMEKLDMRTANIADKNYEDAYAVLAAVLPYQDSVLRSQLQNSAAKAQRDYWIVQNDKTLKEKQLSGAVLSLAVLLMIFVVLILCIVYKKRMMTVQTEKELLYEMSETIRNQMDSLRTHMNESEEKLKSIRREYIMTYKSQFNTLGELCETYIKSADYIITDTFHGTIFSVLFQKNF